MRFLPFVAVIGVLALVSINPPLILFLVFFGYAMSGAGSHCHPPRSQQADAA